MLSFIITALIVHFLTAFFGTIKVFAKEILDAKTEERVFKAKDKIKWSLFVWLCPFIGCIVTFKYLNISWSNGSPIGFGDHIGGGGGDGF